jgi:antitoxin CptB
MSRPDAAEIGRLRWRCRRGMRELDVLLTRYLDERYPGASTEDQEAFRALLNRQDPELYGMVVGRIDPPPGPVANVVAALRGATSD